MSVLMVLLGLLLIASALMMHVWGSRSLDGFPIAMREQFFGAFVAHLLTAAIWMVAVDLRAILLGGIGMILLIAGSLLYVF